MFEILDSALLDLTEDMNGKLISRDKAIPGSEKDEKSKQTRMIEITEWVYFYTLANCTFFF